MPVVSGVPFGGGSCRFLNVPLILNFGAPFGLVDRRSGHVTRRRSFVAGLHTTYALVESRDDEYCLQIDLTPLGARRLFRMPMHVFADRTVELTDVMGRTFHTLVEQLGNTVGWDARFDIAERFLLDRLGDQQDEADVAWAWRRLLETRGTARVADLTAELGWSHKRLGLRFREEIGLTPKKAGRLLRFQHALARQQDGLSACPAEVAADCGFADQAHMIHEFQAFAGMTPQDLAQAGVEYDDGVLET